ncbi:MAG TPA: death-on-curing protein [Candidatus Moranbacteria bacterium]|nr:MAG: RhuM [Candidatus Moranbacteria bacterium GW2011_GWF1_34_10]HBI17487.1 death-on-curing protein [Candidatus Moranbacteria bacterium]
MKKKQQKNIIIYQAKSGAIELQGDFKHETFWVSQAEMARIFNVTSQNITLHLKSIFKEGELNEGSTCKEYLQVQLEGKRKIRRKIKYYNLDAIISVGYRVNSKTATEFRQWATKTLREHIVKGYTINRKQIAKNYEDFMQTVASIQNLLPEHITLDPKMVLELIKEFASTWVTLDAYDKDNLKTVGATKKTIKLSGEELTNAITNLRSELMKKGEATELFAQEKRAGSIEGILGNVMQSFGGKPVYATAEEKAAHLLYFMVKNHPFSDGNKRSGAFAFIWFLRKTKIKGMRNINPSALTVLTLLIAESKPSSKNQMIALITTLLSVKK